MMVLQFEQDVVLARQKARQIAGELGLVTQEQTRLATAVSEIARNAYRYAQGGLVTFTVDSNTPPTLWIEIKDEGPGIENLKEILDGRFISTTGMGLGIIGTKRLMGNFEIESSPGQGTKVLLGKILSHQTQPFTAEHITRILTALTSYTAEDVLSEVRSQNTEILATLGEVRQHKEALACEKEKLKALNQELADTNHGVLALNAELEEQAAALRAASEAKTRFLSHMTHEFRTPVNSILSVTRILLKSSDHDALSSERIKQVGFIRTAAENLSEMINDLLDIAKARARRLEVELSEVNVKDLFNALRVLLRPLIADRPVDLIFVAADDFPCVYTDKNKLSQILRNLISNSIKFTEQGSIKIMAELVADDKARFSVSDTGPGIAVHNHSKIFEEFIQIEGLHQGRAKGTGLGLPLAQHLAKRLGGEVSLKSETGQGATFDILIPLRYKEEKPNDALPSSEIKITPTRTGKESNLGKILIIDDDEIARFVLSDLLFELGHKTIEAGNGKEGIKKATTEIFLAIFLDLQMQDMSGFEVFKTCKKNPMTKNIPIIINSSKNPTPELFKKFDDMPAAILSKDFNMNRNEALSKIRGVLQQAGISTSCQKDQNDCI